MDLVWAWQLFSVALGDVPHVAWKHCVMEAGPKVAGESRGKERKEKGGDSERKGYYTFFIKFPGTKPHQSLSEIEGREKERKREREE